MWRPIITLNPLAAVAHTSFFENKVDRLRVNARHCYFIAEYHICEIILCDNNGVRCDVMGTHDVTPAGVTSHFT